MAEAHFSRGLPQTSRLLKVFDHAHVANRYFCVPPSWFTRAHTFEERNAQYTASTLSLGAEVISRCLNQVGARPRDVDSIVFVSSSGLATPSPDAHLVGELGFRPDTRRIPIFGLGCVGGAAGLSHAAQLARGAAPCNVLLLALELNSITFQDEDFSAGNLVASSLFSDGAAAALINARPAAAGGFEIVDSCSRLWPDSTGLMGWNFRSTGFQVIFSPRIPSLITRYFPGCVDELLDRNNLSLGEISHFLLHPGGARILDAYEGSLHLNGSCLDHSRYVLSHYGNMSSATVLFVLARALEASKPEPQDYALAAAFGPGFSSELLLLRWRHPQRSTRQ